MEYFKIENFERERPGETFPEFESVAPGELKDIRKKLAQLVGFDEAVEPLLLIKALFAKSTVVKNFDATSEAFHLSHVTDLLGLKPNPHVFINWDRFESIDRMKFSDLSKYFDDIWYPSADDIEVFDKTFLWILFINHSGSIRVTVAG